MLRRFFYFLSSLQLAITCLAAATALLFVGTLAQVNSGIHEVQDRYFHSLLVWWPVGSHGFQIPVFPGGHLLGGILLINLIAAHVRRFKWSWGKLGIHLIHAGLIIILLGGLFTDLFSVESFIKLAPGETKNYSEDSRLMELAVIDESGKDLDKVTAISEARLSQGETIEHESLPFRIIVRKFYPNSRLQSIDKAGVQAIPAATQGVGAQTIVKEVPRATAQNDRDMESAVIEIVPVPSAAEVTAQSLGTWLVSDQLETPQRFTYAGKQWQLILRLARYYKPYSLTLQKFTHDRYPGTQIPKNFASLAILIDPDHQENRNVLITMNHPLRYRGETFFQSGFLENSTILQDVYNPSFIAPYLACVIVGLGLLIQFTYHFVGFLTRRRKSLAQ